MSEPAGPAGTDLVSPPAVPAPPPAAPAQTAPVPSAAPSPAAPAAHAQTRWEPFDREAARIADGSLDVCTTLVFPLAIVPGVGDIVGTVGEWLCLIPAAVAVDYAGAYHGGRDSDFWQPALALVIKKGWETLLDTPIMVVTIAALVAGAAGGVAASSFGGLPITVVSAGVFGVTAAVYLGLKAGRDGIGDALFDAVYDGLTPEVDGDAMAGARDEALLHPGVTGVPAAFGLVATVAGSKPRFNWSYAVPVAGPVWRAEAHARGIQQNTRRFAREVLLVEKKELQALDGLSDVLAQVQGYSYATAHVAIGTGLALVGAGLGVSLSDKQGEQQALAEGLGGAGLAAVGLGGLAIVAGITADRLQPLVVPAAWALAAE